MLGLFRLVRRIIEGSVISILILATVAVLGVSETIGSLLADRSAAALLFLLVLVVVLADLIGKFISILSATFPDLVPAVGDDERRRASLIQRLRPVQTVGLLSGAYAARLGMFLVLFALMGASYAHAPGAVQDSLFGPLGAGEAIVTFLREGIAGSVGYFLFFLGPDALGSITGRIVDAPLAPATVDGEILLVGIRLYGLAFALSVLRTLATPIIYLRARRRAESLPAAAEQAA
ncbi:hypothetical protein GCM10009116_00350 [Brevundimonas basaltis]|uniref:Uncharacterized protein n=1 Tax=Brevundimonas basaltis TaxID=472166 RepID=A0A7W8I1F3_9CAUL|nr:hypothetical protein [Brevundimonas basaltis]MBB5292943.1 hypothetical protein [Brevundimonas basaltis]